MIMPVVTVPRVNDQPTPPGPAPDRQPADPSWPVEPPPTPAPQPGPAYGGAQQGAPYQGYPSAPGAPGAPGFPGYPAPRAHTGTNGFAIASLVLGILGGVLLSVIFGIVALVQVHKRGQPGKGVAIGGLVASGCWVLLIVTGVTLAILTDADSSSSTSGDTTTAVTRLSPGDCVNDIEESNSLRDLPVVPCSSPHEGEVYAVFDLAAGAYPGDTAVEQQSEKRCGDEFDGYASTPDNNLELFYLHPLESSWSLDRGVTCIATDPRGPRTGSLRD